MNVLFLQTQPCIRTLKYAYGFNKTQSDINITFGYTAKTLTEFYGYGDEFIEKYIKINTEKNLEEQIKNILNEEKIDLIHSHNTPDFLAVSAINVTTEIPLIHDIHDLYSIHTAKLRVLEKEKAEKIINDEKIAIENANALLYVTEGIKDKLHEKYDVASKKDMVFPNFVPRSIIPKTIKNKLSKKDGEIHIAYEGNVNSIVSGDHYDLMDIFSDIANQNINVHIYSARDNKEYRKLAEENDKIHYHGHLNSKKLLKELTQYDFGWAGFNEKCHKEHLDMVFANKVFEYISAGLPVITLPHKLQKEFIEKSNLGMVINNVYEINDKFEDYDKINQIKSKVAENRYSFCIEENIEKAVNFYKCVLSENITSLEPEEVIVKA